ncbi:DUF1707 SHOCT-like domain-containing protein [Nocardioides sp.]|uniref:DUF1707 SHOCT-like domain-containing protein n=1 Tax=Nocardioides sp. TaxID=35761 RepID=UPI003D0B5F21
MPDPHVRARDNDRDQAIELIEAAFVDGQITPEDRDIRVGNALTAISLGDLEVLTRDLQRPAGQGFPGAPVPLPPQRSGRSGAGLVLVILAVGLGVVLLLGGAVVALVSGGGSTTGSGQSQVAVDELPAPAAEADTFQMTPAGVRRFVADYQARFGTADVLAATMYADGRILVEVPARGHPNRHEDWTYRGAFTQDGAATTNAFHERPIDLRTLNVRRLFANIERAERTLKVPDARFTHLGLSNIWSDDVPAVNIHVGNEFNESGYLKTALGGRVIRAYAYSG